MKQFGKYLIFMCLFLFLSIDELISSSFDTMPALNLEDINMSDLMLVKTVRIRHSGAIRQVYKHKNNLHFYKIWSTSYKTFFTKALQAGFYDKLTPLVALIYDEEGICRGYVTKAGVTAHSSSLKTFGLKIASVDSQTDKAYKEFYALLLKTIMQTGYVYNDLTSNNVIFIDGEYKLIDLEAVIPIKLVSKAAQYARFCPRDYMHYIYKLQERLRSKNKRNYHGRRHNK